MRDSPFFCGHAYVHSRHNHLPEAGTQPASTTSTLAKCAQRCHKFIPLPQQLLCTTEQPSDLRCKTHAEVNRKLLAVCYWTATSIMHSGMLQEREHKVGRCSRMNACLCDIKCSCDMAPCPWHAAIKVQCSLAACTHALLHQMHDMSGKEAA